MGVWGGLEGGREDVKERERWSLVDTLVSRRVLSGCVWSCWVVRCPDSG